MPFRSFSEEAALAAPRGVVKPSGVLSTLVAAAANAAPAIARAFGPQR